MFGVLISLKALAMIRLDAASIDTTGHTDRITNGIGAGTHAVPFVATTTSGAALAPTIDTLLGTERFTGSAGPALGIACIALTYLWGNAVTISTVLSADGLADIRICFTGSITGEATASVWSHTAAMDTGSTAAGHTIGGG